MSLCNELNFLVSPARTVPFSKMRLMISFQRSSCSNFHHECYPIIEKLATLTQQMSTSFLKEDSYSWQADTTAANGKGRDGDDTIYKKYFSHIFRFTERFANMFSSVPSNTTGRKREPLHFVRSFMLLYMEYPQHFVNLKTKDGTTWIFRFCQQSGRGPNKAVSVWGHLKESILEL